MSPLNAAICTTTYLERQKCYGPGKKILFKKQLFDLEVKGQGPTNVITVRETPPYGHAYTNYLSMNSFVGFIWSWGQKSRSYEGHYGMWHTALWSCTHIPNIIDLSRDKNVMARTRKYYLKNNYLTLRSKSHEGHYGMRHTALWSCTHMPNIYYLKNKYHWPIWKDKKVMVRTSFAEKKRKRKKKSY